MIIRLQMEENHVLREVGRLPLAAGIRLAAGILAEVQPLVAARQEVAAR